jgi:phage-related protein (TIGR01555 family)
MALDDGFFPDDARIGTGFNWREGIGFFGYPVLAELSQRLEYRKAVENYAMDMTREWLRFTSTGDGEDDKADKLKQVEAEFERLRVRDVFRHAVELDGFYGRAHVYPDLGNSDKAGELETPLLLDPRKVKKGSLKRLQVVDPTWTYPGVYNSTDPLHRHYYRPAWWYVMTRKVHETRLLTLVGRPVPDMLKAAYSFGGLSLSQIMKPYVDNWLRNRQSASDLLNSFTVFVMTTDLGAVLQQGGAEDLNNRIDMFNAMRANNGLMVVSKGDGTAGGDPGEKLENVSASLAGLNDLLTGAQEQMAFAAGQPLVKYLGVTPSGLNASSDGEVKVWYDAVHASQERLLRPQVEVILKLVQLSLFGSIDEEIGFEFNPLWQLDDAEKSGAAKAEVDGDVAMVNAGIISPEEVRAKLAANKEGPWASLDVDAVPEHPDNLEALAGLGEGTPPGGEKGEGQVGEEDEEQDTGGSLRGAKDGAIRLPGRVRDTLVMHGMPIVIETRAGKVRRGGHNGSRWEVEMPADYGYLLNTWSAEGRGEGMDVFVGPDRDSKQVFVIDQLDSQTGQFDEHKVLLGYETAVDAVEDYVASYSDGDARARIMAVSQCSPAELKVWLERGDLYRPYSKVGMP